MAITGEGDAGLSTPIQSYIRYFNDVKPYRTKILEVLEQYNFQDPDAISDLLSDNPTNSQLFASFSEVITGIFLTPTPTSASPTPTASVTPTPTITPTPSPLPQLLASEFGTSGATRIVSSNQWAGMPSGPSSTAVTIAFWVKQEFTSAFPEKVLDSFTGNNVTINNGAIGIEWDIIAGATNAFTFNTSTSPITAGNWHHVLMSFDTNRPFGEQYIAVDGVLQPIVGSIVTPTFFLDFEIPIGVGTGNGGAEFFRGCLTQIYLTDEWIDLSIPANVQEFIQGGLAIDYGASDPTGTQAAILLNGNSSTLLTNEGRSLDFTLSQGTLSDCVDGPLSTTGVFPTPTVTASITPTISSTPASTPPPGSPTPTVTVTPTSTPASTSATTPTPTVTPSVTSTPPNTPPALSPSVTPSTTPDVTPTPSPVALFNTGYVGLTNPFTPLAGISSFPFAAPFAQTNDLGDLTHSDATGASSSSSSVNGYSISGTAPTWPLGGSNFGFMQRFPFSAPFAISLDALGAGTAYQRTGGGWRDIGGGNGYAGGGYGPGPSPARQDTIYIFPFAVPSATTTNAGSLQNGKTSFAVFSSPDFGYVGGGRVNPVGSLDGQSERFPFASPWTTTSLAPGPSIGLGGTGVMDENDGFRIGSNGAPASIRSVIRYPFSVPVFSLTIGTLNHDRGHESAPDVQSGIDGFAIGRANVTEVEKFPFAAPFVSSTDVGDLNTSTYINGHQGQSGHSN